MAVERSSLVFSAAICVRSEQVLSFGVFEHTRGEFLEQ